MAMRPYPDDREVQPVQLTFSEFTQEATRYYTSMDSLEDEHKFLKFVLAGRCGLDLEDQYTVTVNATQGQRDIIRPTITRDYDSLIGTTKTLPYSVALTVWPVPNFRDTLTTNNHITSIAFDQRVSHLWHSLSSLLNFHLWFYSQQNNAIHVPMHSIPNVALGKVANRSAIRVFFPRMYHAFDSKKIPNEDLEAIYNRCLLPIVRRFMPNQATHWPPNYEAARETSRDRSGRFHSSTFDIPVRLLEEFSTAYLESVQTLRPYFQDAYFGHELRGWKAVTVHNMDSDGNDPAYEHVSALRDLTDVLDMNRIRQDQWLVDVGLEFGLPGRVVTWRTLGHEALVSYLLPNHQNPGRALHHGRSKSYHVDHQMHLKDLAGFRWTPGSHSNVFRYIQAYTTEKAISYQLHQGIFSHRKASELLPERLRTKLLKDLEEQSKILYDCTGDSEDMDQRAQDGCARLEVRVPLADAAVVLTNFPYHLYNETMIQIPARLWWSVRILILLLFALSLTCAIYTGTSNGFALPLSIGSSIIFVMHQARIGPQTSVLLSVPLSSGS